MAEYLVFVDETGCACNSIELAQVERLSSVNEIQSLIDAKGLAAVFCRGKVCRHVGIAAVRFLHNRWKRFVILTRKFIHEDAFGAV